MNKDIKESLLDGESNQTIQTAQFITQWDEIDSIFQFIHQYFLDLKQLKIDQINQRNSGIRSSKKLKVYTISEKFQKKTEIDNKLKILQKYYDDLVKVITNIQKNENEFPDEDKLMTIMEKFELKSNKNTEKLKYISDDLKQDTKLQKIGKSKVTNAQIKKIQQNRKNQ